MLSMNSLLAAWRFAPALHGWHYGVIAVILIVVLALVLSRR